MTNPKLTPLLSERQFYAAILVGLPLLVFGYVEAFGAIVHGEDLDAAAMLASLSANPIVLYLLARQIPRKAAIDAVGAERAADVFGLTNATPDDDETLDEPDDGFGGVSTGGAHDAVNRAAEAIDADAGAGTGGNS